MLQEPYLTMQKYHYMIYAPRTINLRHIIMSLMIAQSHVHDLLIQPIKFSGKQSTSIGYYILYIPQKKPKQLFGFIASTLVFNAKKMKALSGFKSKCFCRQNTYLVYCLDFSLTITYGLIDSYEKLKTETNDLFISSLRQYKN